jgi:hypothetical protein
MLIQPINSIQYSNSTNFRALKVGETEIKEIEQKAGNKWAEGVRNSLPKLREMASFVDILIFSKEKSNDVAHQGIVIRILEKMPDTKKNFLNWFKLWNWAPRYAQYTLANYELKEDANIADEIVKIVTFLKNKYGRDLTP